LATLVKLIASRVQGTVRHSSEAISPKVQSPPMLAMGLGDACRGVNQTQPPAQGSLQWYTCAFQYAFPDAFLRCNLIKV